MFFWVFPRRQIVVGRRFGTLCQFHLQWLDVDTVYIQPLKMELTQGSETSANYNLTLGKYPKEHIQHHIMFLTNIAWCNVPALCTPSELLFLLPVKWNKKVKGYNKTKSCQSFWNAKCYAFYTYRWIYCQHNYPNIRNSQNKNEKIWQLHLPLNMTNSNSYCFSQHTRFS